MKVSTKEASLTDGKEPRGVAGPLPARHPETDRDEDEEEEDERERVMQKIPAVCSDEQFMIYKGQQGPRAVEHSMAKKIQKI